MISSRRPRAATVGRLVPLLLVAAALALGWCHEIEPGRTATAPRPTVSDNPRAQAAHSTSTETPAGPPGTVHTLSIGGMNRTYRAYLPDTVEGRLPLLVVLHGRGQSWRTAVQQTGFLGLARRGQAVLVFPDGVGRSWNAGGGCCGVAAQRRLPDSGFVTQVLTDALGSLPVDPARVYLVGYSNGGKLAYSLSCQHPTMFAAMASYGSVPLAACPAGTSPTPYLLAAGQRDTIMPFNGAARAHPPLPSVRTALSWLRAQDGCTGNPTSTVSGHAVVQRWTGCRAGSAVQSVAYSDVGHTWPAVSRNGSPSVSSLMWSFLTQHRLPIPPASPKQGARAVADTPTT